MFAENGSIIKTRSDLITFDVPDLEYFFTDDFEFNCEMACYDPDLIRIAISHVEPEKFKKLESK